MTTWAEFAAAAPELAAFGKARFREAEVAYLATVRADGSPRVHPVTPVLCGGRLYLFMEPTSPKGRDLHREPRYAMHSLVTDQHGNPGEFHIKGRARPAEDADVRARVADAAPYEPMSRWILFEFSVEEAASTEYTGKESARRKWSAQG